MMQRHRTALLLALLTVTAAYAQPSPEGLSLLVGNATADRDVEAPRALVEIKAATDASTAAVTAARTISRAQSKDVLNFTTVHLTASAPLAKGGDPTLLASSVGFPNSFALKGKFIRYSIMGRRTPDFGSPRVLRTWEEICAAMRAEAVRRGRSAEEAKKIICDTGNVQAYVPDRRPAFDALFWDPDRRHYAWGGSASAGHRALEYLDPATLEKQTSTRTPWAASAFGAVVLPRWQTLLGAGVEYREKPKEADTVTACPQSESDPLICRTGPLGGPSTEEQEIAYLEVRRMLRSRPFSLKVAYDFAAEQFTADLPIYLLPSAERGYSGGILIGWVEGEDPKIGVFVTSSFSLLAR